MSHKKLGLLLLPLVPLSAIGIVELANRVIAPEPTTKVIVIEDRPAPVAPPQAVPRADQGPQPTVSL